MDTQNTFLKAVENVLLENVTTSLVHNKVLTDLTNENSILTNDWESETECDAKGDDPEKDLAKVTDADSMKDFINKWLANPQTNLYLLSQNFLVEVMSVLNARGWSDAGPQQMSVIQQFLNVLNSEDQKETQVGQTMTKTETSVAQNDVSSQQPISDMGKADTDIDANVAGLLQQGF